MGKTKTTGKGRLDKFYYLAKEQGYRSRAAFKLVQLNRKYQFLEKSRSLLDLCAAPGGWLQVAAKYMPVSSLIIGVDLVPIRPVRGCVCLTEDITTAKCRSEIKKLLKDTFLDTVLHDGSPNVGGAWAKEALNQAALSLDALKLATEFLRPGGTFVSKVFRSQDYNSLLYAFKQLFHKVEATKPMASRATSAEIYVIGIGYKAPAKIDPRLLSARHVFKEVIEPPKIVDVLSEGKAKRQREGYEEGVTMLYKTSTASEFMACSKPVDFLGTFHAIKFTGPHCTAILEHPSCDSEVKASCEDLRVLAKREFKNLLRWRMAVRKALPAVIGLEPEADGDDAEAEDGKDESVGEEEREKQQEKDEEEREEGVLDEMRELQELVDSRRRRARKTLSKRKEKAKTRAATGMHSDIMGDVYGEEDLFSLRAIKSTKQLNQVDSTDAPDEDEIADTSDDEDNEAPAESSGDDEDFEGSAAKARYFEDLEEYFDEAYEKYRAATDGSSKRRARARLAGEQQEAGELWQEDGEDGGNSELVDAESAGAEGGEGEGEAANPLLVSLEKAVNPVTKQRKVALEWFSQDLFDAYQRGDPSGSGGKGNRPKPGKDRGEVVAGDDSDDPEVVVQAHGAGGLKRQGGALRGSEAKKAKEEGEGHEAWHGEVAHGAPASGAANGGAPAARSGKAALMGKKQVGKGEMDGDENVDFEVVAADSSGESSSSDEGADYDSDAKAETVAIATKMLRKRQREDILDAAYGRYTFDDVGLPRWFAEDERRHSRPEAPVTREEVAAIKAQNRAIDARPLKKVAEAKARKRRMAMKKLEAVRQKATAIADQDDLNNKAKGQAMERLYKKALAGVNKPRTREVVVSQKGAKGNRGKGASGKVMVDRRMKSDSRGMKKGGGASGGKSNGGGRGKSGLPKGALGKKAGSRSGGRKSKGKR